MRRVLVEQSDGAAREVMARTLEAAGFHVETCAGPSAFRGRHCPLVGGGDCDMAHSADVIVCGLHLGSTDAREVLHAHSVRNPGTPVIVEASRWQAESYAEDLGEHRVLEHPTTRERLVEAVQQALTEG